MVRDDRGQEFLSLESKLSQSLDSSLLAEMAPKD